MAAGAFAADDNVRRDPLTVLQNGNVSYTMDGDRVLNALKLDRNTAGQTVGGYTLTLSANQQLTVSSGAIVSNYSALTLNGNTGILHTGANPLILAGRGRYTINSDITNNITDPNTPGLIAANCDNETYLQGAHKNYGGMTLVQAGLYEYQAGTLFIGGGRNNNAGYDVSTVLFQNGSTFAVEISADANDMLTVWNASLAATLELDGGTVQLSFLDSFTPRESDTWLLTSGFSNASANFKAFTVSDLAHPDWEYKLTLDNNNLRLTLEAIPEPSTWALLLGGAALLLTLRRKRAA